MENSNVCNLVWDAIFTVFPWDIHEKPWEIWTSTCEEKGYMMDRNITNRVIFFYKWEFIKLAFGDMKKSKIWKIIFRLHTFRWKNFAAHKNSSRRTPRLSNPKVKFDFLNFFRKITGWWRDRQSNRAEKFWKEIWYF